jgi:hypothetical protein
MVMPLAADQVSAFITKKLVQNLLIECTAASSLVVKGGLVVGADDGSTIIQVASDHTVTMPADLDTGVEALSTWYYVWVIWNPTTEVVNVILSASDISPIIPSGFTKKRLIGAVYNDGSGNLVQFLQRDDKVYYRTGVSVIGTSYGDLNWHSVSIGSQVPSGASAVTFTTILTISGLPLGDMAIIGWCGNLSGPAGSNGRQLCFADQQDFAGTPAGSSHVETVSDIPLDLDNTRYFSFANNGSNAAPLATYYVYVVSYVFPL